MRSIHLAAALLVAAAAFSQIKSAAPVSALPPDPENHVFSCATSRVTVTDQAGARHYRYRAVYTGIRTDGAKWTKEPGPLRTMEKQATRDCQLWQELSAAKKREAVH